MARIDFGNPDNLNLPSQSEWFQTRAELESQGWTMLQGNPEDMDRIAQSLGPVVPDRRTGADFCDLLPHETPSAPTGSMSSLIGTGKQPMHTDGAHLHDPPRYIVLFCLNPGEVPCSTQVWQIDVVRMERDWPSILCDPNWVFDDRLNPPFYSPVLQCHKQSLKIRFDPCCMKPAARSKFRVMEALNELEGYAHPFETEWQQGTAIIIDNWRCLHGRGAVSINSPSRRLRRWCIRG